MGVPQGSRARASGAAVGARCRGSGLMRTVGGHVLPHPFHTPRTCLPSPAFCQLRSRTRSIASGAADRRFRDREGRDRGVAPNFLPADAGKEQPHGRSVQTRAIYKLDYSIQHSSVAFLIYKCKQSPPLRSGYGGMPRSFYCE